MKIYLDDLRQAPKGYVRCHWPDEVIELLKTRKDVEEVSLDHDLGDDKRGTGYDVLTWIEEQVICNGYNPPYLVVHSMNPVAIMRMNVAIKMIERLSAGHKK